MMLRCIFEPYDVKSLLLIIVQKSSSRSLCMTWLSLADSVFSCHWQMMQDHDADARVSPTACVDMTAFPIATAPTWLMQKCTPQPILLLHRQCRTRSHFFCRCINAACHCKALNFCSSSEPVTHALPSVNTVDYHIQLQFLLRIST